MSIYIANTSNTSTFQYWLNRTNELAYQMTGSVMTSDATGNVYVTNGNATLNGVFTANGFTVGNSTANTTYYAPNSEAIQKSYVLSANGSWVPPAQGISNVQINSTANAIIDTYDINKYVGCEYIINASDAPKRNVVQTKILVMNDYIAAYQTEYATIFNNVNFISVVSTFNTVANTVEIYLDSSLPANVFISISKILVNK
jgi:hypothetical protein